MLNPLEEEPTHFLCVTLTSIFSGARPLTERKVIKNWANFCGSRENPSSALSHRHLRWGRLWF